MKPTLIVSLMVLGMMNMGMALWAIGEDTHSFAMMTHPVLFMIGIASCVLAVFIYASALEES